MDKSILDECPNGFTAGGRDGATLWKVPQGNRLTKIAARHKPYFLEIGSHNAGQDGIQRWPVWASVMLMTGLSAGLWFTLGLLLLL
jgi:hypothetical protein